MNITLTASNLLNMIASLDRRAIYDYPNDKTRTKLMIKDIKTPEGPITIKRWDPSKGETQAGAKESNISATMLWRLASAIKPDKPVNIDRVFGASYNTRSALEALLLHTENFYICYPGRLEKIGPLTEVKEGHKHIIYCPNEPHRRGVVETKELSNMVISEVDRELHFDALVVKSEEPLKSEDIEIQRRHAQIQIMLIEIAKSMSMNTWVAKNDHGIEYGGKRLIELDSVIKSLESVTALQGYDSAPSKGELIDCIWFTEDGKKIPAVIEIEHSTGVTSGLTRMNGFRKEAPELKHMTFIIAAPDELREQVFQKAHAQQFRDMEVKFLPYSAVEDMYYLSKRRITGIDPVQFFHTFLEDVDSTA